MQPTRIGPACIALLCACGPNVVPQAELEELCGQQSPLRILELSADEPLSRAGEHDRVDERRIIEVGYLDEAAPVDYPHTKRSETWSVGMCGESPLLLGEDMRVRRYADVWPDTLLACREATGELVTIDPYGERDQNVVLTTPECRATETPHGLVVVQPHDEDTGALVLLPWVDDPWTETAVPRVLLDPIRVRAVPSHTSPDYHEVVAVRDDAVFAITPADELVHLSLVDGTITPEASGVREIEVSEDGRWVIWQDVVATSDDADWPPGAIYLRDRAEGTTTYLADAPLAAIGFGALAFVEAGVVRLQMGYLEEQPERLWFLPEMLTVDLPLDLTLSLRGDDGRWVVRDHFGRSYWLFDAELRESRELFGDGGYFTDVEGGFEILAGETFLTGWAQFQGSLWFVPWDGERQRLAPRATPFYARLDDGRVVTTVDLDDEFVGDLVVVDPPSAEERLVDHRVVGSMPSTEDEVILYGVSDGDRTGVWLTALAPRGGE